MIRLIRQATLVLVAITAAAAGMASVDTNQSVGFFLPAAVFLVIGAIRGMQRRFPSGIWLGLGAMVVGLLGVAMEFHIHTIDSSRLPTLCAGLLVGFGQLVIISEVIGHWIDRAWLRRKPASAIPVARVVDR